MHVWKLECRQFRRLSDIHFEPSPGLNIIRGNNAQGKTTVLEAILYAATSRSHRTNTESELVQHGAAGFHVQVWGRRNDREAAIEANWWEGVKRFKVNGIPQTRLSDILGRLNVVLFSPEDVDLVKAGAAKRRRFLDMELSQIQPRYLNALQHYRQVLRQRNELLHKSHLDMDVLAAWDTQLALHGRTIIHERRRFIEELAEQAAAAYARIADGEAFHLAYQPDVKRVDDLEAVLEKARPSDMKRRVTTRGPHRDDVDMFIAEHPARNYGSQGQQKTAALALKLAELELVKSRIGEYPVLMLDEVFAELDAQRSRELLAAIHPQVQCIITTTGTAGHLGGIDATAFRIEAGNLEKT